jgi:hypothetical protein
MQEKKENKLIQVMKKGIMKIREEINTIEN